MKRNTTTKIAALIALVAIFGSVVGTGILIVFDTFSGTTQQNQEFSQEELNQLLQQYASSGALLSTGSEAETETTLSGVISEEIEQNILTGTTN